MPLLRPREYYASVLDIDPHELIARGIKGVLLDVDNTLMPRTDTQVPARMADWVARCQEAGLQTLVLSNSFQGRVVCAVKQLGCAFIGRAMKPLPGAYKRAAQTMGLEPAQLCMVGDQTYTDILGANLAGIHSILVMPLGKVELWHTKAFRFVERVILCGMHSKGKFPDDIYTLP